MARPKKEAKYPGVTKMPNGRYRAIIPDPDTGKNLSVATVLGMKGTTWETAAEAHHARCAAEAKLREVQDSGLLLGQWWQIWTTSPLWLRPKESTNIQNRQATRGFVERYGDVPMTRFDERAATGRGTVGDQIVAEWLADGKRRSTIMALRAMFNDARSAEAGRLLAVNPFAGLRAERSHGRGRSEPPNRDVADRMVEVAREHLLSFAMWLKFAMGTGMRPAEIDALRWDRVDREEAKVERLLLEDGRILSTHVEHERIFVGAQFNNKTRTFTLPKNGQQRRALITPQAREALDEMAAAGWPGPYCFPLANGAHMSQQARTYYFKPVRAVVGWTGKNQDLYLATRHYAGKYLYNDLRLSAEDVAAALGHTDNGMLVRKTYGHLDHDEALERVAARVLAAETPLAAVGRAA